MYFRKLALLFRRGSFSAMHLFLRGIRSKHTNSAESEISGADPVGNQFEKVFRRPTAAWRRSEMLTLNTNECDRPSNAHKVLGIKQMIVFLAYEKGTRKNAQVTFESGQDIT